ncbi:squalene-hopene/tetraprenyl-beta-curcumene cyclase [Kitasatospora sp. MAP12-15]|uniref:terpene cyclase/mutase family protein n=1 Tax=unclassified Kitasatospora TaxID=2633591 RepID=UPI002476EE88|nr:terpene cyclase/mutase family protein [Kitasatospora sp. MAP12-44]MDH6113817.1 squalene-hopene/tetraprenyl-beta-curcumene cyclase [Kitasatospora sp. MAP12-44]
MAEKDAEVLRCRDRLAQRVAARLGPDGLIAAPCESRVLESALALRLLTAEQAEPAAAARLTGYLRSTLTQSPPDPLQCAIARAALGGGTIGGAPGGMAALGTRNARDALDAVAQLSSEPEHLLLRIAAAEVGAIDFPRTGPSAPPAPAALAPAGLEMTAVSVLAAYGSGTPHAVSGHDWATLAPACRPGPARENTQLARLLGLLALRNNPAYRPAVRRALPYLTAGLRPDGGLPFIAGMDVRATAVAGLALVGARHPGPHPGVLADALAARQNPDGGFGCHPGLALSDVDDTARCLAFLRTVAPGRHHGTITAAEEYLLSRHAPDGGFRDLATTAAVAHALAADPAHHRAVERAVDFVTVHQRPDGGFERRGGRTAAATAFHAVQALDATRPAARQLAIGFLCAVQNEDGGFGHRCGDPSDPVSTAYAAAALSRSPAAGPALRRALGHLVGCRQPDGGYRGRPEQVAPRPLPYDVPVLAESCVLLGLAHATTPAPASDRTVLAAATGG